jgi:hypothetical protein
MIAKTLRSYTMNNLPLAQSLRAAREAGCARPRALWAAGRPAARLSVSGWLSVSGRVVAP